MDLLRRSPCPLLPAAGMIDGRSPWPPDRGVLAVLCLSCVVYGWPVRVRAVGGCCVGLALKLEQSPASFTIPLHSPFLTTFSHFAVRVAGVQTVLTINPAFFAIANGLETLYICHTTGARHRLDIRSPIRLCVQAVAGIVVAAVAYTASCDVGGRGLCLIGQPASDWSNTSNSCTAAFTTTSCSGRTARLPTHILNAFCSYYCYTNFLAASFVSHCHGHAARLRRQNADRRRRVGAQFLVHLIAANVPAECWLRIRYHPRRAFAPFKS
jgi:hypothetical protein